MKKHQAWIVTVDMGYGHQRATYPLRDLSPSGKVLIANNYEGIPKKDRHVWQNSQKFYETVSRFTGLPLIGRYIFDLYDKLQAIPDFYPRRDLSAATFQLKYMYKMIRKGWGRDLVNYLNKKDIPLITSFFVPAFFAEEHGFKNEIYCVVCDADISRTWAPLNPTNSRIKYLTPCRRATERLMLYGVKKENIFLAGFPLPQENIGNTRLDVIKSDLSQRIANLDPNHHYRHKYGHTVVNFLQEKEGLRKCGAKVPVVTFAVGGAGAQRQLAFEILRSLRKKILKKELKLNLVAGSRNDVYLYFKNHIRKAGLSKALGKNLNIIFAVDKHDYFEKFNEVLRCTDVLWTKPSELVFYSALGLPVIMAPTIGSQEKFNKWWLKKIGAGITQNDPKYTHEWLFDWIEGGILAEAAMSGFLDSRQFGLKNIIDVVFNGVKDPSKDYQLF